MADVQQVRGGAAGLGPRDVAGRSGARNFHGAELSPSRDVDDVAYQSALRSAITGRGQPLHSMAGSTPRPRKSFNVSILSAQDVARHAKVSGDERDVNNKSQHLLRQRLLRPNRGAFSFSLSSFGRGGAMRQYLALQKMQAAVKAQEAARQRSASEAEAEGEFMAAMAPLSDNPGNAAALAQRFYEELGHDADLQDLLSGFEDDQRVAFMDELRGCAVVEEYDAKQQGYRKSFDKGEFCAALKRAMRLDHYRVTDEEARDLLEDVQGQLAQMEDDPDFYRFKQGAINIVAVAEEMQQEGQDPAQFIENYSALVHTEGNFASMCKRAAELYVRTDETIDPEQLRKNMEAASRAANLDMDSTLGPSTDKAHLWAAVQSAKLIARLSTAVMLAQTASGFLKRHFGRDVNVSQLLHQLLQRMAQPNASPTAFFDMARDLKLDDEAMPATLKQAADFFRSMHDMYPDAQMRQILLQNVADAMDEAARMEDERLAALDYDGEPIRIAAPDQPKIPSAPDTGTPWTGFSKP
jgi:hypothetical protein